MAQSGFFAPPLPRILAHRGLCLDAVENTTAAFRAAIAVGAAYVETDARITADGTAVLFHDDSLFRLTGSREKIAELTVSQLQNLTTTDGLHFSVPTLTAVLAEFPTTNFNIDIKDVRAQSAVLNAVLAAQATHRVVIASFSDRIFRSVREHRGLLLQSAPSMLTLCAFLAVKAGLYKIARWLLQDCRAVQIPTRIIGLKSITARVLRGFHAAGVEVHYWTINDPVLAEVLFSRGADGLVTDRCDAIKP